MEIIIDVIQSDEGRLTGTVGLGAARAAVVPFSGTMELVACVERLCRTQAIGTAVPDNGVES